MGKLKVIEIGTNENAKSMIIAGTCIIDAVAGIYYENLSYNEVISSRRFLRRGGKSARLPLCWPPRTQTRSSIAMISFWSS